MTKVRPVNKLFADTVKYWSYRYLKESTRYNENGASELQKMKKSTTVQKKDQTFNEKDLASIIAFLKDLKATWNA